MDLFLFIFERKSAALRIVITKKNINGLRIYVASDKLWFVLILNSRWTFVIEICSIKFDGEKKIFVWFLNGTFKRKIGTDYFHEVRDIIH